MNDTDELMARAEIMLEIVLYEQLMARRGWLARLLTWPWAWVALQLRLWWLRQRIAESRRAGSNKEGRV